MWLAQRFPAQRRRPRSIRVGVTPACSQALGRRSGHGRMTRRSGWTCRDAGSGPAAAPEAIAAAYRRKARCWSGRRTGDATAFMRWPAYDAWRRRSPRRYDCSLSPPACQRRPISSRHPEVHACRVACRVVGRHWRVFCLAAMMAMVRFRGPTRIRRAGSTVRAPGRGGQTAARALSRGIRQWANDPLRGAGERR